MKTKYTLLTGMAMLGMFASFGQVEYDDMYFNAKDRAQLNASKQEILASQYKKQDLQAVKSSPINPTDSYSGRSVNPEYTNRLKTNPSLANNERQYFVSGYNPVSVNQNLVSNNCNCSNSYGGYGMNRYGMNSGFGSPYNSFYSPWGMGGGYQPGWSSMMGYSLGGMNSGWYGGMNYGNSWANPWNYGYGGGSYYNNYGFGSNYYGNNVVVVNGNGGDYRNPNVYGKRVNRSSDINNTIDRSRPETGYARNGREAVNGRSRSDNQSQYYDRNWKRDPEKNPSRSVWSDNSSNNASNQSRSAWNNQSTSTGRQSSDFGNSRTSFDSGSKGSSAGSTSTGSSSSGSSGSSRSRGRD